MQISFRTKLAEDLLLPQADLWFGCTQVSLWPDLSAYRGRGDLTLTWDGDRARTGLTWRSNLRDIKRGSLELNWLYPVGGVRGQGPNAYLQVFSGYGETLLDYNVRQTSIGLGVTLFNF